MKTIKTTLSQLRQPVLVILSIVFICMVLGAGYVGYFVGAHKSGKELQSLRDEALYQAELRRQLSGLRDLSAQLGLLSELLDDNRHAPSTTTVRLVATFRKNIATWGCSDPEWVTTLLLSRDPELKSAAHMCMSLQQELARHGLL